jgi:hypothetical protein
MTRDGFPDDGYLHDAPSAPKEDLDGLKRES